MKFKAIGLLLNFICECPHAWDRIAYMNWEDKLLDIHYHREKKLWYLYLPYPTGISPTVIIVTDNGCTIYLPDCIDRLVYNGDKDMHKAWDKITNDEPTWEMVNALMLAHNF